MPRFYTRKRGKTGMSLRNALTYKNQNGLPQNISNDNLEYIASGSYGSIYAFHPTNIVFKKHNINIYDNRSIDVKCASWKHEFNLQKQAYQMCNRELQEHNVCIARPYWFRHTKASSTGLQLTNEQTASACIFTMDRITGGTKWNKYLTTPNKSLVAPYIFMGTLESGPNRITLESLKDAEIINMPNESHSFCYQPGIFGMNIQKAMIESFFILIENELVPRDVEFIMDGRKHTQTLIAIIDFNEAKTTTQRANAYGEGYNIILDAAHVYIDLCGLRSKSTENPMAPYDVPTPQWKFLCNPIICPSSFLECMKPYRVVANIILDYAFIHKMKSHIVQINWKPLYVYRVENKNLIESTDKILGTFTDAEYYEYRFTHCEFYKLEYLPDSLENVTKYIYAQTMDPKNAFIIDRFAEYDIQFQYYIIGLLIHRNNILGKPTIIDPNDTFRNILDKNIVAFELPIIEEWEDMGLF